MGIRFKILSGFLILSLMLFIAGILSIIEFSTMGESVERLIDDNYKSINASKTMIEGLEREDSGILLLMHGNWDEGRSIIETGDSIFKAGFNIASNNITIEGEAAIIDSIRYHYRKFQTLWVKPIVDTRKQGNINWYFKDVHNEFLASKYAVEKLMDLNDQAMYSTATSLRDKAKRAIMPGIVAIVASLVFTLIFNYFINYFFVSPLLKIVRGINEYITKKSNFNVNIETHDEMMTLKNAIQNLVNRSHLD